MKLINTLLVVFVFAISMVKEGHAQTLLPDATYFLSITLNGVTQTSSSDVGIIFTSYATVGVTNGLDPQLSVNVFDTGTYTASATATLTYYVEVYSTTSGTIVPVDISGLLSASSSTSSANVTSSSSFQLGTVASLSTPTPSSNTTTADLSSLGMVNLVSGTVYQLTLNSTASINTAGLSFGSASIDPSLTIDPSFNNPTDSTHYTILYSKNFGPTQVPEPGSVQLIGLGLMVLFLGSFLRFSKLV